MGRHQRACRPPSGRALPVVGALVSMAALLGACGAGPGAGLASSPRRVGPPSSTTTTVATSPSTTAAGGEGVPPFAHIFVVLMENLGASQARAVPALTALAARYESTSDWYAVSHPSLPNYLALVSGSTWGVTSDCTTCYQSGPTLASQLDQVGISWDAYFGGLPGPCFLGPQSADGSYAEKHDPFAYFTALRSSPADCAHLLPLSALAGTLSGPAAAVPRFVWVTPTMCDSGHDCTPSVAGAWLSGFVDRITASAAWRANGVLVVTWDEGEGDDRGLDPATGAVDVAGGGRVLTLVVAPGLPPGRTVSGPFDHYSLLRTVEDAFGLPHLGLAAGGGVRSMGPFFAGVGGR